MSKVNEKIERVYTIEGDNLASPVVKNLFGQPDSDLFLIEKFTPASLSEVMTKKGWVPKKYRQPFAEKISTLLNQTFPDAKLDKKEETDQLEDVSVNLKLEALKFWFNEKTKNLSQVPTPVFSLLLDLLVYQKEEGKDLSAVSTFLKTVPWKQFENKGILQALKKDDLLNEFLNLLSRSEYKKEFESLACYLLKDAIHLLSVNELHILLKFEKENQTPQLSLLLWGNGKEVKPYDKFDKVFKEACNNLIAKYEVLERTAEKGHPQALDYVYSLLFDKNNDELASMVSLYELQKHLLRVLTPLLQGDQTEAAPHLVANRELFGATLRTKLPLAFRKENHKSIYLATLFGNGADSIRLLNDLEVAYKKSLPEDAKYKPINFDYIDGFIKNDFSSVKFSALVNSMANYSLYHQTDILWPRMLGIDKVLLWSTLSVDTVTCALNQLRNLVLINSDVPRDIKEYIGNYLNTKIDADLLKTRVLELYKYNQKINDIEHTLIDLNNAISALLKDEDREYSNLYQSVVAVMLSNTHESLLMFYWEAFREMEENERYQSAPLAPHKVLTKVIINKYAGENTAWGMLCSLVENLNSTERLTTIEKEINDIENEVSLLYAKLPNNVTQSQEERAKYKGDINALNLKLNANLKNLNKDPRKYDADLEDITESFNNHTIKSLGLLLSYKALPAINKRLQALDTGALNQWIDVASADGQQKFDAYYYVDPQICIKYLEQLALLGNETALNQLLSRWKKEDSRFTASIKTLLAESTSENTDNKILGTIKEVLTGSSSSMAFKNEVYDVLYEATQSQPFEAWPLLGDLAKGISFPIPDYSSLEYRAVIDLLMPENDAYINPSHSQQIEEFDTAVTAYVGAPELATDDVDPSLRSLLTQPMGDFLFQLQVAIDDYDAELVELKANEESPQMIENLNLDPEGDIDEPHNAQDQYQVDDKRKNGSQDQPIMNKNKGHNNPAIDIASTSSVSGSEKVGGKQTTTIANDSLVSGGVVYSYADVLASAEQKLYDPSVSIADKSKILDTFAKLGDQKPVTQNAVIDLLANMIWATSVPEELVHKCLTLLKSREGSWSAAADKVDEIYNDAQDIIDTDSSGTNLKKLAIKMLEWLEEA